MSFQNLQRYALRSDGVIRREDALHFLNDQQLRRLVRRGSLLRISSLVYVDPVVRRSWNQSVRIAAWSLPQAAVSGEAAARLWQLRFFAATRAVSLVAPWRFRSSRTTNDVSFSRYFREPRVLDGIRVTSIERTLIDLAATVPTAKLKVALSDSFHLRLTTISKVRAELELVARNHAGIIAMRKELQSRTITDEKLRSQFEDKVLRLSRKAKLPEPEPDFPLEHEGGKYFADFCWPDQKIFVEVDGGEHYHPEQVKRDRLRSNVFAARGFLPLRYGEETDPERFFEQLRRLLITRIDQ